ncbi:MAG: quinolinate synthase NadA [Planctomycetes bacterium]|nr:quinolinate synthase NadA [Planctomycetota bacterium]
MMPSELTDRINQLKTERKAVILAHNYTRGEVQDIADYVGDSLGLSQTAASTDAEVIVFCGVHFMAETAAILSPDKRVIMPDHHAGCPMADMVTPRELAELKKQHPEAIVVTYVNSTVEIKAMTDLCCTSANAVEVVRAIPDNQEVIFVPDRNLGSYVATQLGRKLILWNGFCPTHERIFPEHVELEKEKHPEALFVAHPECRPAVLEMADHIASTTGILRYCHENPATEFIIGTEIGLLHRLRIENPGKKFYPASPVSDCPNMKLITLEKIAWCLEDLSGEIKVPEETARAARRPIERMLEVTGA